MRRGPIPPSGQLTCPLHKKDVAKVCPSCPWYTELRGTNPNTGEPIDEWGCAISWLPILLIESTTVNRSISDILVNVRNEKDRSTKIADGAEIIKRITNNA